MIVYTCKNVLPLSGYYMHSTKLNMWLLPRLYYLLRNSIKFLRQLHTNISITASPLSLSSHHHFRLFHKNGDWRANIYHHFPFYLFFSSSATCSKRFFYLPQCQFPSTSFLPSTLKTMIEEAHVLIASVGPSLT